MVAHGQLMVIVVVALAAVHSAVDVDVDGCSWPLVIAVVCFPAQQINAVLPWLLAVAVACC